MLNSDALSQLTQLKQNIRESKDIAEGTVRGTKGRYGFVVLDDDREAFLDPDQMNRVFPGDRVEVSVTKNEKDQYEATLEKLLSSDLKEFVGSYLERGKGHFVVPDVPMLSRWIFLPPKARAKAGSGDFIRCRITRHPFEDSKSQAKVIELIGKRSDESIERSYIINKFQLRDTWSDKHNEQLESLQTNPQPLDLPEKERKDFTDIPFVTIDSESTKDMDDAIFAKAQDSGWQVFIAIADPSSGVGLDSPLGRESLARGQTIYFPGNSAPMIPDSLSQNTYSLVEGEKRPALVIELNVGADGTIENFEFSAATICSKAKLSYDFVSEFLDDAKHELSDEIKQSLTALKGFADARLSYRQANALVMEERPDYEYQLNEQGKIANILRVDRNSAQKVVEESMLATNVVAGQFFANEKLTALYSTHAGFREDRLPQVTKLLAEEIGEDLGDLKDVKVYQKLISDLQADTEKSNLLSVLKRQLRPSELSFESNPHLGLGFQYYANITSPIRRFNDLYNHLVIKQYLGFGEMKPITDQQLETLKEQNSDGRYACRQLEQWLICQYMEQFIGSEYAGQISMVTSQGVGIRLDDNGVEVFVQLRDRKNKEQKVEFNPERLTLVIDGTPYVFDQQVTVKITEVDQDKRNITGTLVD